MFTEEGIKNIPVYAFKLKGFFNVLYQPHVPLLVYVNKMYNTYLYILEMSYTLLAVGNLCIMKQTSNE